MSQKYKVKINVINSCDSSSPVIESRKQSIRSKVLDYILGEKLGIFVVVPGDDVESVEIYGIKKGEQSYGKS